MSLGYALFHSKRSWYVPDVQVWGRAGWAAFDYLILEEHDNVRSIGFNRIALDEGIQSITYGQLTDFRGNQLPEQLSNPKVFVKGKSDKTAFVSSAETNQQFQLATASNAVLPVSVDLYIIEMN